MFNFEKIIILFSFEEIIIGLFSMRTIVLSCVAEEISIKLFSF